MGSGSDLQSDYMIPIFSYGAIHEPTFIVISESESLQAIMHTCFRNIVPRKLFGTGTQLQLDTWIFSDHGQSNIQRLQVLVKLWKEKLYTSNRYFIHINISKGFWVAMQTEKVIANGDV